MKGFSGNNALPYPNYKDVFELLDEEAILQYYIPNLELNSKFKSPLGDSDDNPSFSVFWSYRKHKYIFKDFRYGYSGDCIDFVRHLYGYSNNSQACMRIFKDFNVKGFTISPDIQEVSSNLVHNVVKKLPMKKEGVSIHVTLREWSKHDLDYWMRFGITLSALKSASIFPISHYFLNGSIRKADKYAYAFVEKKDDKITFKIYQPYNNAGMKWRSNNDLSVWELWELLPEKHSFLIITKSRKDALSIMCTTGIPATSLQAEGTIPKSQVIDELKERFTHIFLFYDNDFDASENWGQLYSEKLSKQFDIPSIFIPVSYQAKDYTDFIVKYNIAKAKEVLLHLIKQQLIWYKMK